jgi:hypothetical protein
VLIGAIVGAMAAIIGQLISERYRRHRDRQMTAGGLAASIEATLLLTDRRGYALLFEDIVARLKQGQQIKPEKLLEDASIDPITAGMLDRAGLLGHDLPGRIATFMHVLTGIRTDLVRWGKGEFDNPAKIFEDDLALWREFEPKARLLVRDLRNHANEPFRFWSWQ